MSAVWVEDETAEAAEAAAANRNKELKIERETHKLEKAPVPPDGSSHHGLQHD